MTNNDDLCREIARLAPDWYRDLPGVAVKDPETGLRWRLVGCNDAAAWGFGWEPEHRVRPVPEFCFARALAAGPDWTDGSINMLLGSLALIGIDSPNRGKYGRKDWMILHRVGDAIYQDHGDTLATAILMAYRASLGG